MRSNKSKEFLAELKVLCKIHHINVVELLGFASGDDHLYLVYEFISNGSLSEHLHDPLLKGHQPLSWTARAQIALDAAGISKADIPFVQELLLINLFVESRSQFKSGLVNHAFAAALRSLLLDYQVMVAQLEHQFRLGRLSIQGLWFYCQPMMGSMQALSIVIKKASAYNFVGSAVLHLLDLDV